MTGLSARARGVSLRLGHEVRGAVLGASPTPKTVREDIAREYLAGSGIEIGALNFPLRVPRTARVRYVDFLDEAILRDHHHHLIAAGQGLVFPDVVDDGERLEAFASGQLDSTWSCFARTDTSS